MLKQIQTYQKSKMQKNFLLLSLATLATLGIVNIPTEVMAEQVTPTLADQTVEGYEEIRSNGTTIKGQGFGILTHFSESEGWTLIVNTADMKSKLLQNGDTVWNYDPKTGIRITNHTFPDRLEHTFTLNGRVIGNEKRVIPYWVSQPTPRVIKITPRGRTKS
jgi:hypothetical protein